MNKKLISATALSALAISTLSPAVFADNTTNPSLPSSYQRMGEQNGEMKEKGMQTGVQNLTSAQRTSLETLRASLESDIKTIRDSYKPTVDSSGIVTTSLTTEQLTSLKASLDILKTTYTDKVNALGITDVTSSTYVLNGMKARIDMVYTNLSNFKVGNKLPVENQGNQMEKKQNRMENKGMGMNSVSTLTSEQKIQVDSIHTALMADLKSIRTDTTLTQDTLKTKLDALNVTYTAKVKALALNSTSESYLLKMVNEVTSLNSVGGNRGEIDGIRDMNKGMNQTGGNKNQIIKPVQTQTNPAIEKAVDKILLGKDTATQTSILNNLKAKIEAVLPTYQAKTDANSGKIVTLLNQLNISIDKRLESLNSSSPILDLINSISQ